MDGKEWEVYGAMGKFLCGMWSIKEAGAGEKCELLSRKLDLDLILDLGCVASLICLYLRQILV